MERRVQMRPLVVAIAFAAVQPALAEETFVSGLPPYTEAVLPVGTELYALAIGPGGPGEEFGSSAPNGGLYRLDRGGDHKVIVPSDGQGLLNPTGMVELDSRIVLVDGNQVISLSLDGDVTWRSSYDEESAFFYDIEVLDDATLLASDFGRGAFVSISAQSGAIEPYLEEIEINGLARFEIVDNSIYAVSWGADDAWNSAVYLVSEIDGQAQARKIADGFGNLESIEIVEGKVTVGGYRGHEAFPDAKLMQLDSEGNVHALNAGSDTGGISDIYFDGRSVWLTYFYDAAFEHLPAELLFADR